MAIWLFTMVHHYTLYSSINDSALQLICSSELHHIYDANLPVSIIAKYCKHRSVIFLSCSLCAVWRERGETRRLLFTFYHSLPDTENIYDSRLLTNKTLIIAFMVNIQQSYRRIYGKYWTIVSPCQWAFGFNHTKTKSAIQLTVSPAPAIARPLLQLQKTFLRRSGWLSFSSVFTARC